MFTNDYKCIYVCVCLFSFVDQTPTATNANSTNTNAGGQLVPPPLTPGTNKKMTEALQATFASWEKERHKFNVPKGKFILYMYRKIINYLFYLLCNIIISNLHLHIVYNL